MNGSRLDHWGCCIDLVWLMMADVKRHVVDTQDAVLKNHNMIFDHEYRARQLGQSVPAIEGKKDASNDHRG